MHVNVACSHMIAWMTRICQTIVSYHVYYNSLFLIGGATLIFEVELLDIERKEE